MASLEEFDKIEAAVAKMEFREPLEEIRDLLADETQANFENEVDTDGNPWAELKPETIRRKKRLGRKAMKILQREQDLVRSLEKNRGVGTVEEMTGSELEWGTDIPYGHFHMSGTVNMAKREFLGISDATEDKIEQIVADHAEKVIAESFV